MNVAHWHPPTAPLVLATVATVLTLIAPPQAARATYPGEVRQDHPLAYWRFEDAADKAENVVEGDAAKNDSAGQNAGRL
ncbi:MAG TPA: hypothetical protein VGG30_11165, partial [Pirellulales bacterium]